MCSLSQHVCFLPSPAPEFAAPYSSRVALAATLFSTHMRVGELCVGEHGQAGGRDYETGCVGIYVCLVGGFWRDVVFDGFEEHGIFLQ